MTLYETRLQHDLAAIRQRVAAVARDVCAAVAQSVEALIARDRERCYALILGDLRINREVRAIDAACHAFVARHLPAAGHLRFVTGVLRMNIALERIGDYAVTIARQAVQLESSPPPQIVRDIQLIADQSVQMLEQSVRAFAESDAALARGTKPLAARIDHTYEHVLNDFVDVETARPLDEALSTIAVLNKLERVSDQAKNICEEIVFIVTGETKPPKRYRVLFVTAGDDGVGPLANAIARKRFAHIMHFDSAGWAAADALAAAVTTAASQLDVELAAESPVPITATGQHLDDYHVIVSLAGDLRPHLPGIPFHTVIQEFDSGAPWPGSVDAGFEAAVDDIHRLLSQQIVDLVVALRGEEVLD